MTSIFCMEIFCQNTCFIDHSAIQEKIDLMIYPLGSIEFDTCFICLLWSRV